MADQADLAALDAAHLIHPVTSPREMTEHGEKVRARATATGAVRQGQHHTIDTGLAQIVQGGRGCASTRVDGIAVVSFARLDERADRGAEPDAPAAAEALTADEPPASTRPRPDLVHRAPRPRRSTVHVAPLTPAVVPAPPIGQVSTPSPSPYTASA